MGDGGVNGHAPIKRKGLDRWNKTVGFIGVGRKHATDKMTRVHLCDVWLCANTSSIRGAAITIIARIAASAVISLGLSACNVVTSTRALITGADLTGAPTLATGVWADDGCTAEGQRRHASPCAVTYAVSSSTVQMVLDRKALAKSGAGLAMRKSGGGRLAEGQQPSPLPYVLSGDRPTIFQVEMPSEDGSPPGYLFFALDPISSNPDGAVVEAEVWPILCGPPPTEREKADFARDARDAQDYVPVLPLTYAPFPGMEIHDSSCDAKDRVALVAAARQSRGLAQAPDLPFKAGRQRVRLVSASAH